MQSRLTLSRHLLFFSFCALGWFCLGEVRAQSRSAFRCRHSGHSRRGSPSSTCRATSSCVLPRRHSRSCRTRSRWNCSRRNRAPCGRCSTLSECFMQMRDPFCLVDECSLRVHTLGALSTSKLVIDGALCPRDVALTEDDLCPLLSASRYCHRWCRYRPRRHSSANIFPLSVWLKN